MRRIVCLLVAVMLGSVCFGQTTKDAMQNPGFPRVVAALNLLDQTNAVGPVTLYTPTESGVFRISGTMVCTISNGKSNTYWNTRVTWANENGHNNPTRFADVATYTIGSSLPSSGSPFVFNANGGSAINITTSRTFDTSGSQYNAYIILEQLE